MEYSQEYIELRMESSTKNVMTWVRQNYYDEMATEEEFKEFFKEVLDWRISKHDPDVVRFAGQSRTPAQFLQRLYEEFRIEVNVGAVAWGNIQAQKTLGRDRIPVYYYSSDLSDKAATAVEWLDELFEELRALPEFSEAIRPETSECLYFQDYKAANTAHTGGLAKGFDPPKGFSILITEKVDRYEMLRSYEMTLHGKTYTGDLPNMKYQSFIKKSSRRYNRVSSGKCGYCFCIQ